MKCQNCNARIQKGDEYCQNCGCKISEGNHKKGRFTIYICIGLFFMIVAVVFFRAVTNNQSDQNEIVVYEDRTESDTEIEKEVGSTVLDEKENTEENESEISQMEEDSNNTYEFVKAVSGNLNIRSLPQHDSNLVGTVQNSDEILHYNGTTGKGLGSDGVMHDWYQITTESGVTGWVRSDLVIVAP